MAVQTKRPVLARAFLKRGQSARDALTMRQSGNRISDPAVIQPLLFAPSELLACGLRDAHHNPLVGKRTVAGVRSWRTSPARAWALPLVEWSRTGNSYAAIGFDCDSREAVERASASCMGAGDLPTPNVYATRSASGHAQVFYLLDRPVHRGERARVKPLTYLARVVEFYRATLRADAGYTGVLSSNPVHDDYQATYPRADPYALGDLASWIPNGWRVPRPATTADGRNVELFRALCRRGLRDTDRQLEAWAHTYNDSFVPPLDAGELRGILRSVYRYRDRWRERGHKPEWLWKQAALGRRSGEVRLARVSDRDRFIVARLDARESVRAVARAFGVSVGTVSTARSRGVQRTNTVRSGFSCL